MADLRLQSGRVQAQNISSLPQPNMNFGQRQPQIEYQAAAETSSVLSRTLSSLSSQMFTTAEKLSDSAAAEFVIQNPPSEKQLIAMSKGDPAGFQKKFTLNAFGAAVQKFQENELSAHAEIELIKKVNEVQQNIDLGRDKNGVAYEVNTKRVIEDFKAMSDGWAESLAQISPDAAYKYRATAATHVNRLITASAKKENQLNLAKNKIKIIDDVDNGFTNTITNIIKNGNVYSEKDGRYITINEQIAAEREALVSRSLPLGGADAVQYAIERANAIESAIKQGVLEEAALSRPTEIGSDLAGFTTLVQEKRLPANLQNIWDSLTVPQQKEARDKIKAQFLEMQKIKDDNKTLDKAASVIDSNSLILDFLNPNANAGTREAIQEKLIAISKVYPDVISAKSIYVDLPKMVEEKAVENWEALSKLDDLLRNQDPRLKTTESIMAWAKENNVSGGKAMEIANRYLPKNEKEISQLKDKLDFEFLVRSREKDPKIGRPIKTVADAKQALEARGLTLSDAPSDLTTILTKPADVEDNAKAVTQILSDINNNIIKDPVQVYERSIGKGIKTSTVISLAGRVEERNRQLISDARQAANDIADAGGGSLTAKAQNKLQLQQEIVDELSRLQDDWWAKGAKGAPPSRQDAVANVEKRFNDQKQQKMIDNTNQQLQTDFGAGTGSRLPEPVKKSGVNLLSITPQFKQGTIVSVTDEYRRMLRDTLKSKGASDSEADMITEAIIRHQVSIETISRSRRLR